MLIPLHFQHFGLNVLPFMAFFGFQKRWVHACVYMFLKERSEKVYVLYTCKYVYINKESQH